MPTETLVPGVSLGCPKSLVGTLGFFACFERDADWYAVTCSHSLAPLISGSVLKPAPHMPGQCDVHVPGFSIIDDTKVGQMTWAASLDPHVTVTCDCGLARLSERPLPELPGFGKVSEVWKMDTLPVSVVLVTGNQQLNGTLLTQDRLAGPLGLPARPDGPFQYTNLFAAQYEQEPQPGMSGSLILSKGGELVGMHIAGQGNVGYFHRVSEILSLIGMVLYRS